MFGRSVTFSRTGIKCKKVIVEVDIKKGLPAILITGMLSREVREVRERIQPAIINSGLQFPVRRITIHLSPAETVKTGSHYDLAIAVSLLKAFSIVSSTNENNTYFGELNLKGEVKGVRGILPLVLTAINCGSNKVFVSTDNINELSYLKTDKIIPVSSVIELIEILKDIKKPLMYVGKNDKEEKSDNKMNYSDILGQQRLVEAFKIAAAGGHHMLIVGPPGCGKTMAAKRLPAIMPPLKDSEILEINMINSVFDEFDNNKWITKRPFRNPHSSASIRALIGGGPKISPGEVSLAHKGILFLDEFLEFRADTLQALRTVIERKEVYISMRTGTTTYPADILLIAATNPCPCGYYDTEDGICSCSLKEIKKYRKKLFNPLTDRIDLQIKVERIKYSNLKDENQNPNSEILKADIDRARIIQAKRYKDENFKINSLLTPDKIHLYCRLDVSADKYLEKHIETNYLSARAAHKIITIARTVADICESDVINLTHIKKALSLRFLDNEILTD